MREAREALFQTGRADVDWGDALVEIANRSLDTVTDAARRDRFRVHMYINGVDSDDPAVLFADNRRARWRLGVVEHRDHGCRVPGCSQRRWVQVHHVVHYGPPDNGPSDTWNLICLCPHHHRLHRCGKLGITGNAPDPGDHGCGRVHRRTRTMYRAGRDTSRARRPTTRTERNMATPTR